jgi:hypothetical protein
LFWIKRSSAFPTGALTTKIEQREIHRQYEGGHRAPTSEAAEFLSVTREMKFSSTSELDPLALKIELTTLLYR